ncbi:hypothetical protein [Priestia koreensis]|uniref:hypothetical protein n=1 Tax=Priestia koreensis TaxID=284581 RepID=UPI00345B1D02
MFSASEVYQLTKRADAEDVAYVKKKKAERKAHADRVKAKKEAALEKKRLAEEAKLKETLGVLAPGVDAMNAIANKWNDPTKTISKKWDDAWYDIYEWRDNTKKDFQEGWKSLQYGTGDAVEETWNDLKHTVLHPVDTYNAVKKTIEVIAHDPLASGQAVWEEVSQNFREKVIKGDANDRVEYITHALTGLGISAVGGKGLDKVVKGLKATKSGDSESSHSSKNRLHQHVQSISHRTQYELERILQSPFAYAGNTRPISGTKDLIEQVDKKSVMVESRGEGTGKNDYVEETGRLGGKHYSEKDLRLLGNYLEKRGVKLKVGDEFLPQEKEEALTIILGNWY